MTDLIYLNKEQLRLHPKNLRRFYPVKDVESMAVSIEAAGGVIQALLVIPIDDGSGMYWVVDGNMRLAGARHLGDDCPPLKCEVIGGDQAEQLLIMAATSEFHFPKDPISKALHYKRLEEEEGLSRDEIANSTGVSISTIYGYLRMLNLDAEIQQLIADRELNISHRVTAALMRIPDANRRIGLAERFAKSGASERRILASISHVIKQLNRLQGAEIEPIKKRVKVHENGSQLRTNGKLGSGLIMQLAETHLCEGCRLDGLGDECWACPGPYEFINSLVEKAELQVKPAA